MANQGLQLYTLNHLAVFHLFFYAVLFPSVLFFSHILATKILSVGTIKKDGKYYRKSLQYAWSFTLLSKMRKGIYFPLCFTNELQKLPQNDKN